MSRILLVAHEGPLAETLQRGLAAEGHTVVSVSDRELAATLVDDSAVDVLIVDLGIPGDATELVSDLRHRGARLPIIVLADPGDDRATVAGLHSGADDYVTKPVSVDDLSARIRVATRIGWLAEARSGGDGNGDPGPDSVASLDMALDLRTRTASVNGRSVALTLREFTLLEAFLRYPDQVLSREQLLSQAWGYDFDPGSNVIDVYVGYLRRKLGNDTLETIRGMGYRLRNRAAVRMVNGGAGVADPHR